MKKVQDQFVKFIADDRVKIYHLHQGIIVPIW